ncbi:MAG: hypothetical protein AAF391_14125 [Bacteroidota bacterium]
MKAQHLDDEEIQGYLFDPSACEQEHVEHIHSCEHCTSRVATYQLIAASVANEEIPAFDFELSTLVLQQLPRKERRFNAINVLVYLSVTVGLGALGCTLYVLKSDLLTLSTSISALSISFILCVMGLIFIPLIWETYLSYQRKMNMIEFS